MFNAAEQKDKVIRWIRDWFKKNSKEGVAVIGISGGKDSTVAATLCAEALGNAKVFGVILPDGEMPDYDAAHNVCVWLSDTYAESFLEVNIGGAVNAVLFRIMLVLENRTVHSLNVSFVVKCHKHTGLVALNGITVVRQIGKFKKLNSFRIGNCILLVNISE